MTVAWRFWDILFDFFWPWTCPNRSEMAVGFTWTDFQPEPSILDPFRTIFDVLRPTWKSGLGHSVAWRAKTWPGRPNQARTRNAKSGFFSTLFVEFPGNATNFVGSAGSTLFEEFLRNATKNLQKKVPEWDPEKSSGICGPG